MGACVSPAPAPPPLSPSIRIPHARPRPAWRRAPGPKPTTKCMYAAPTAVGGGGGSCTHLRTPFNGGAKTDHEIPCLPRVPPPLLPSKDPAVPRARELAKLSSASAPVCRMRTSPPWLLKPIERPRESNLWRSSRSKNTEGYKYRMGVLERLRAYSHRISVIVMSPSLPTQSWQTFNLGR
jgi:hypothetical protein